MATASDTTFVPLKVQESPELCAALDRYEAVLQRVPAAAPDAVVSRAQRLLAHARLAAEMTASAGLAPLTECRDEAEDLEKTPGEVAGDAAVELLRATHYLRSALNEAVKETRRRLSFIDGLKRAAPADPRDRVLRAEEGDEKPARPN